MGQFSWLDCVTGEQIIDNKRKSVYVLVPKEFGGGHIREGIYDGYGHFGGHDIYDLVAEWNREELRPSMLNAPSPRLWNDFEWYKREVERHLKHLDMMIDYKNGASDEDMEKKYGGDWKRLIGIYIACHDEQNEALPYPIKITYDKEAVYEDCKFSPNDPNQGWR